MDVANGAIRRRPFGIVERIDPDDPVDDFIPPSRKLGF
jgi:hypothetical protein